MKAAVLYQTGSPLVVEEGIDIPDLKPGQVLVRIAYSGVCRSQLMEVRGKRGDDRYLPHLLGHEGSGWVVETGAGVGKVKKGDPVILGWIKGDGADCPGTLYQKGAIQINAGSVTTLSEMAVVSENRCTPLPAGIPMDTAALLGCAVPTGAGIVLNTAKPEPGSTVALFGLGGIGLSALISLNLFQCRRIIAVDVSEEKLALARELGATDVIHALKEEPLKVIADLTDGRGVDISLEAGGLTQTIEMAFQAVRKGGGRCLFASHPPHGEKIALDPHDLISGKQIQGSWGGGWQPDRDTPRYADHFRSGRLPLEKLISHRYPLEGVNQALDDLEAGRTFRALVEIDHHK